MLKEKNVFKGFIIVGKSEVYHWGELTVEEVLRDGVWDENKNVKSLCSIISGHHSEEKGADSVVQGMSFLKEGMGVPEGKSLCKKCIQAGAEKYVEEKEPIEAIDSWREELENVLFKEIGEQEERGEIFYGR